MPRKPVTRSRVTPVLVTTLATLGLTAACSQVSNAQSFLTASDGGKIGRFNTATNTSTTFASGLGGGYGLAIGPNGDVYASEYSSTTGTSDIHHFSASGADLGSFGTISSSSGVYDGLGFDSHGTLYALDSVGSSGVGQLHRFSAAGTDQGTFISGLTNYPGDFSFNSNGDVLISISNTGQIRRFSSTGADLGNFAVGQNAPTQVAFDKNGNVYVNNFQDQYVNGQNVNPHHIEKFSSIGTDLGKFASTGGQGTGLAFDGSGNLWSATTSTGYLEEYSSSGTRIATYYSGTSSPRELRFVPNSVSAAPEPSEWAALGFTGLSVGGLLLRARRRKTEAQN